MRSIRARTGPAPRTVAFRLIPLLIGAAVVGCGDGPSRPAEPAASSTGAGEWAGKSARLDLAGLQQELGSDRAAALARYRGKTTEVEVRDVTVRTADANVIELRFGGPVGGPAGPGLGVSGYFWLTDPRNAGLKGIASGAYRGRVGGIIAHVRPDPDRPTVEWVELRPAWVVEDLKPAAAPK
jgi:hypothetical protein